ncbi:hypothetical protein [Pendulispora albinea]|uniref:EthD domain-containing protein n=1 Tax=Pendulispora albinea TaxID=2741071 RepID=A0ABZ2LTC0_9BACT
MKKSMLVSSLSAFALLSTTVLADDPGAPVPVGQSVIVLFKYQWKLGDPSWQDYRDQTLVPKIRDLKNHAFQNAQVRFLSEDSDNGVITLAGNLSRTWPAEAAVLAASGLPVPAPYEKPLTPVLDVLVKMDLPSATLTQAQLDALRTLRQDLTPHGRVNISETHNYQCYKQREARDTDVFMAFTNQWLPDSVKSRRDQDTYWRERHGRFAVGLGLPKPVISYGQVHVDLVQPDNQIFDTDYEGLSFETIESRDSILRMSTDPGALATNAELIKDEQNFTGAPNMLVFEEIKLTP